MNLLTCDEAIGTLKMSKLRGHHFLQILFASEMHIIMKYLGNGRMV